MCKGVVFASFGGEREQVLGVDRGVEGGGSRGDSGGADRENDRVSRLRRVSG